MGTFSLYDLTDGWLIQNRSAEELGLPPDADRLLASQHYLVALEGQNETTLHVYHIESNSTVRIESEIPVWARLSDDHFFWFTPHVGHGVGKIGSSSFTLDLKEDESLLFYNETYYVTALISGQEPPSGQTTGSQSPTNTTEPEMNSSPAPTPALFLAGVALLWAAVSRKARGRQRH